VDHFTICRRLVHGHAAGSVDFRAPHRRGPNATHWSFDLLGPRFAPSVCQSIPARHRPLARQLSPRSECDIRAARSQLADNTLIIKIITTMTTVAKRAWRPRSARRCEIQPRQPSATRAGTRPFKTRQVHLHEGTKASLLAYFAPIANDRILSAVHLARRTYGRTESDQVTGSTVRWARETHSP
jgi:hypothetical protein